MTPQPFTPTGFRELQDELNALSASDLQAQANLIKSDLVSWVNENFTLDTAQQTYLSSIDSRFIELAAALTGFAVENKLSISLVSSDTPTTFKLIHLTNTIEANYSPDGFTASGTLTYTVNYQ
jgi:hypothetical protein